MVCESKSARDESSADGGHQFCAKLNRNRYPQRLRQSSPMAARCAVDRIAMGERASSGKQPPNNVRSMRGRSHVGDIISLQPGRRLANSPRTPKKVINTSTGSRSVSPWCVRACVHCMLPDGGHERAEGDGRTICTSIYVPGEITHDEPHHRIAET